MELVVLVASFEGGVVLQWAKGLLANPYGMKQTQLPIDDLLRPEIDEKLIIRSYFHGQVHDTK